MVIYTETIIGEPITKKNHQQICRNSRTGKSFIRQAKRYIEYEQECEWQIKRPFKAIDVPCNVKCIYYMPTKRRVDLVNLLEATLDILVRCGVLADDNSKIVVSMDGSRVLYDKVHPRVVVTIETKQGG